MAIIGTLLGLAGHFAGKVLTTTLGWASTLLFGRLSKDRQMLLAGVTFGSIAWAGALVGVAFPDIGIILVAAVPRPPFVSDAMVRLAMLAIVVVVPLVVGVVMLSLLDAGRRPSGRALVRDVLRGYPLTLALAVTLAWLAVVAAWRKADALAHGRTDAHIPIVTMPGHYEDLVRDLSAALDRGGLPVERRTASRLLSMPTRLLVLAAGSSLSALVPERFADLVRDDLTIGVHPSDLAITGSQAAVGRSRAVVASRLASASAYLTTVATSQKIEDRLKSLDRHAKADGGTDVTPPPLPDLRAQRELEAVDRELASGDIPYDDWDTLYRLRLQVERDLRAIEAPDVDAVASGRFAARLATEAAGLQAAGTHAATRGTVASAADRAPGAPAADRAASLAVAALLALDLAVAAWELIDRPRRGGR